MKFLLLKRMAGIKWIGMLIFKRVRVTITAFCLIFGPQARLGWNYEQGYVSLSCNIYVSIDCAACTSWKSIPGFI